ncbi:MAG TPA: hypothetical protein DCO75_10365, partial [Fibrobacteres bacterium]|nr:hypothetical protein [Fibrobacterota bacterium]
MEHQALDYKFPAEVYFSETVASRKQHDKNIYGEHLKRNMKIVKK